MTTLINGDRLVNSRTNEPVMEVRSSRILHGKVSVLHEGEDVVRLVSYEDIRKRIASNELRLQRAGAPKVSAPQQNDPKFDAALARVSWVLREMRSYMRRQKVSALAAYDHAVKLHMKHGLEWPFPPRSTVYRWLKHDGEGLPVLVGDANKGNRTRRRPEEVVDIICDIAEENLLPTESRWSFKAVAKAATAEAKERGLLDAADNLTIKYVRRIVAENLSVDLDYDRMDPRTRKAAKSIAANRILVNGLLLRVEQDALHLPWRVRTKFGVSRDVWLVHAIDCESGMPVGWKLVIGAPREADGLDCVECMLFSKAEKFKALGLEIDVDFYGTPALLVFDNGPEAKGDRMKRLTRLRIDPLYLSSHQPQGKPFIERLNRSLKEALETLPGTTRFDGVDGARDPEVLGDVDMDIEELERWIVRWYFEKWANTQLRRLRRTMFMDDRKLGHTPAARVTIRMEQGYSLPLPPNVNDWQLTRFDRDVRTLSRKTGISYADYHFKSDNLNTLIAAFGETPVDILFDRDDWRFVYVPMGTQLVQLVNEDTDQFTPALSFQEAKAQEKEAEPTLPPHPKAAQFDKDIANRSKSAGAQPKPRSTKATSQSTTAKSRQKSSIDRTQKPLPPGSSKTSASEGYQDSVFLEEAGTELAMTNRHTGEAA